MSAFSHPLAFDRFLLRCDKGKRLAPRVASVNAVTGLVEVKF